MRRQHLCTYCKDYLSVTRVTQQFEGNGNANVYFIDKVERTEIHFLEANDDDNASTQEEDLRISCVNREINRRIVRKRKFTVGLQRGILNPLPPNFKFTTMTITQLAPKMMINLE